MLAPAAAKHDNEAQANLVKKRRLSFTERRKSNLTWRFDTFKFNYTLNFVYKQSKTETMFKTGKQEEKEREVFGHACIMPAIPQDQDHMKWKGFEILMLG